MGADVRRRASSRPARPRRRTGPSRGSGRRTPPRPRRRRARGRRGRARRTRPGARAPLERRVGADADRGRVALAGVEPPQPAGVHPVGGRRGHAAGRHVGRRVAELAAALVAARPPRRGPTNGRPSAWAAPATSPAARQVRTYVDDQTCGPPSRGTPIARNPSSSPLAVSVATSPEALRAVAEVRADDHDGRRAGTRPAPGSRTPAGVHAAISRSNGRASTSSTPHSASSSARVSRSVSVVGACSGRSTAIGCGSNVTATTRSPSASASAARLGDHVLVAEVDAVEVADHHGRTPEVTRDVVQRPPDLHAPRITSGSSGTQRRASS